MLGYIRRNFCSVLSSLKLILYKRLIRSKMKYPLFIWDPHSRTLIQSLEHVQYNASRFCFGGYSLTASVTFMKTFLQLPPFSTRRKCFRLAPFHKLHLQNSYRRGNVMSPPTHVSPRIDHCHKVEILQWRTTACHEPFLPRTAQEWNHLPGAVVAIEDIAQIRMATADIIAPSIHLTLIINSFCLNLLLVFICFIFFFSPTPLCNTFGQATVK